jgi:hypothetical protein
LKRITLFSLLMLFVQCVTATTTPAQTSEKDSAGVQREVREVFDKWSTALGRADKKTYLDTFWNSPRLVIRVANGEWRGIEAYRKRIEAAQLPPASPSDYKNVEVVALGRCGSRDLRAARSRRGDWTSGRVPDLQRHGCFHTNCGRLEDRRLARALGTGEELGSLSSLLEDWSHQKAGQPSFGKAAGPAHKHKPNSQGEHRSGFLACIGGNS